MQRNCLPVAAVALIASLASQASVSADENVQDTATAVFSQSVSDETLAGERGGRDNEPEVRTQVINNISTNGRMENISISNSLTGDNTINDGSFSNSHGFPMVIQNSGNGVLIQNSTILNVTIEK